ncbi:chitinase [Fusarium tjaetaba]|uniref:Chitinase n=1 Tax=Fusarium tjaetaba TaxID=1567544 RepID=A0A8H5R1J3_9HYPO|nr:chitinase [Fusarium tjaetaba]KAF5626321.1 chitinase [Fusarium tjaetaba]
MCGKTVVKLAKEIKKAQEADFITHLISTILLLIRGAGSVIFQAGFRFIGRMLVGLAEAGNTGVGIYTALGTPESVPMLIFGLVMSAANIRDVARVTQGANLKRSMKWEEIADFSAEPAMPSLYSFYKFADLLYELRLLI